MQRTPIPNLTALADRYVAGESVSQLAPYAGVSGHMLRRRFVELGIMRDSVSAVKNAYQRGRMDGRRNRKGFRVSEETKLKQSETLRRKHDKTARGWSIKPNGYIEYTRGEHAGRSVHVVAMEQMIGRRIRKNEVVHHIDGDRANNEINNLALMTRGAHARLHRFENKLAGKVTPRNPKGQFERNSECKG